MANDKLNQNDKTYNNLKEAFAGESQAALRYMYYAKKAKQDGFEYIADILNRIAHNEIEHAKIWYKLLNDGMSDTLTNIKSAANGEKYEWELMYKNFEQDAKDEGYEEQFEVFEENAPVIIKNIIENYLLEVI